MMKQEAFIGSHIPSTAEVYIGIGKPAEATACTQEAANLFPMSHYVLYMRGQVAELRGNIDEAKRWYEEALSISPTHVKSMQRLVSLESMFISTFISAREILSCCGVPIGYEFGSIFLLAKSLCKQSFLAFYSLFCVCGDIKRICGQ